MILFNICTQDDDELRIDENTTEFFACFFGFFPHNLDDNIESFIVTELELSQPKEDNDLSDFRKNGNTIGLAYAMYDRRCFDHAYILPKTFSSKQEAENYINTKIKESDFVTKSMFDEIEVVDANKVMSVINEIRDYKDKEKAAKKLFEKELQTIKSELSEKYQGNEHMMRLIKNLA